jgi:polyisoprenyl-phosphate glycosyltransferase
MQHFQILVPVYNDWQSLRLLLDRLDGVLSGIGIHADVLVVDDGSPQAAPDLSDSRRAIDNIRILALRRNLGHQRAIAVGLSYIHEHLACDAVVVMDADGEDDPADVPGLIEACRAERGNAIVFAQRAKRSEGPRFVVMYFLFRRLYRLLTGTDLRIGNFSVIPWAILRRLTVVSEIWSHYVGGVLKSRLPYKTVSCDRAPRLAGRSQMNLVSLIAHGLSAIAIHGDVLGVRLLIATSTLIVGALAAIIAAVVVRMYTSLAIPGWATYVVALSVVILIQAIILSLFFIFIILSGRNAVGFIPQRDYSYFILDVTVARLPNV